MRVMKKYLLSLFFILSTYVVFSQNLSFKSIHWEVDTIQKGIIYKYHHFDTLFSGKQSISVLDINLNQDNLKLRFAYLEKGQGRKKTSELAQNFENAIVAINGTFFNMREGGSVCFLKVDGKLINPTIDKESIWFFNQEGAITVDKNENVKVFALPKKDTSWASIAKTEEHVMASGPILISNEEALGLSSDFDTKHPRTAIGITKDNHLIFLTIDGRTASSIGVTIPELTQVLQALNCINALNLDGGGSTSMWIKGKEENGIVNFPCDNKRFDKKGERTVANAIIVIDEH